MKEDIRKYARIGLVHHMLYPESMEDPDEHVRTLEEFIGRDDIETLDCCIPFGEERRRRCIAALRGCGKEVAHALHLFPVRKIPFSSTCAHEQGLIRLAVRDQIQLAQAVGATALVFVSGPDVPEHSRPEARRAFADFCRWLSAQLAPYGITALLEPFDRTFDKKFLYGPTSECVALIRSLEPDVRNLAIELDIAHLPLMGETFAEAIRTTAPYLRRVHLGNCVMKDPSSPFYGDRHPPIGFEGGEIDVPQLAEALSLLLQAGYLNTEARGALLIETQPFPERTAEETVADQMERLRKAWEIATEK